MACPPGGDKPSDEDINLMEMGFQTGFRRDQRLRLTPLNRGALFLLLLVIVGGTYCSSGIFKIKGK